MKKPTVSSSYSSKPFLFDGKFPNFTAGKGAGTLDRFEEEKRNAKEKYERLSVYSEPQYKGFYMNVNICCYVPPCYLSI